MPYKSLNHPVEGHSLFLELLCSGYYTEILIQTESLSTGLTKKVTYIYKEMQTNGARRLP